MSTATMHRYAHQFDNSLRQELRDLFLSAGFFYAAGCLTVIAIDLGYLGEQYLDVASICLLLAFISVIYFR
jgi:hypothetical protein